MNQIKIQWGIPHTCCAWDNSQDLYNNIWVHEIQIQPKCPLQVGKGSQNLTNTWKSKRNCKRLRLTSSNIWSCIEGCYEEVIRACGGLPAGPPPHEDWDISHTLGNHQKLLIHHWTIKHTDLDHAETSWSGETIKSKGNERSLFLIWGTKQERKLEPRYISL